MPPDRRPSWAARCEGKKPVTTPQNGPSSGPPLPPTLTVLHRFFLAWRGFRDRRVRDADQAAATPTIRRLHAEGARGELAVADWLVQRTQPRRPITPPPAPAIPGEDPPAGFPAQIWQRRRQEVLDAAAAAGAAHDRARAEQVAEDAEAFAQARSTALVAITAWAEQTHLRSHIYHRARLLGRRRTSYGWHTTPFEFHTEFATTELVDGVHLHRTPGTKGQQS